MDEASRWPIDCPDGRHRFFTMLRPAAARVGFAPALG
jgi:hypothetical protein